MDKEQCNMNKEQYIHKIQAVINTLNNATVRADQIDVVQRIDACTRELKGIIKELSAPEEKTEG
jgi:hypothetical protein